MLAIEVEYLMGRAVATDFSQRDRAEWPPHPQRLFSALVAAHCELDLGARGEAALKWLESLPPPEIKVDDEPSYRSPRSHWVPINDEAIKLEKNKADFRHVLERRNRQERFFPAAVPGDPVVVFQWPQAPGASEHRSVLSRIVSELTYLGHSSSPVRGCLREGVSEPTLVPSEGAGKYTLRVPGPGRLTRLKQIHQLRLEEESIQPPLGRMQGYVGRSAIPRSEFDPDAIVLVFDSGPRLSLDSTLPLMQHLRAAVLSRLGEGAPEVLTGHGTGGSATTEDHVAFVPLAFVGSKHADGSLKGAALVLPRGANEQARRRLRMVSLEPWQLRLGPLGSIQIRYAEPDDSTLLSLQFGTYSKASDIWASVTPLVFDRHAKKGKLTAEQIVTESCIRAGIPAPVEVRLGPASAVLGAPLAKDFHGRSKQTEGRVRQHVLLRFDRRIRGPLLLGAGRFIGLGVFVPLRNPEPL
jgi:CRISPR-associated protein Csb2